MYSYSFLNTEISRRIIPMVLILGIYVAVDCVMMNKRVSNLKTKNIIRGFTDILIIVQLAIDFIFLSTLGMSAVSISSELPKTYNGPYYFTITSAIIDTIIFIIGCYFIIKNSNKGNRLKPVLEYFIISIIVITIISYHNCSLEKYVEPNHYYHKIV